MKHLLLCREYPPAPYPAGGIGTYAQNIATLLAEHDETVHVIAQRWKGAPSKVEEVVDGRLVVHRVDMEPPLPVGRRLGLEKRVLYATYFPSQAYSWEAAHLAEELVRKEGIDLVEGQDWEAPLYYYQLRRYFGHGPERRAPCLLHFHSPTEMIVRANEWDETRPDRRMASRIEEWSIAHADSWMAPSRFLAREAATRFGLSATDLEVVPYPRPAGRPITRGDDVWAEGSILYVGRLEPRKGVLEWVEAAVEAARRDPSLRFEFVGPDSVSDGWRVTDRLHALIPDALAGSFAFHGEQPRERLAGFLARARVAVVPSRWDNLPNACLEAMASGLPVLTTRQGGMAELVVDGETGWVADEADVIHLAAQLDRIRGTPAEVLQQIGERAAQTVARVCDPDTVLAAHLALRRRVVASHTGPTVRGRVLDSGTRMQKGVVVVLVGNRHVRRRMEHLAAQTQRPDLVVVANNVSGAAATGRSAGLAVTTSAGMPGTSPVLTGADEARPALPDPVVFLFLGDDLLPEPTYVEALAGAFDAHPELGVVTSWGSPPDPRAAGSPPALPDRRMRSEEGPSIAIRARAMVENDLPVDDAAAVWRLVDRALGDGWAGACYPGLLARRVPAAGAAVPTEYVPSHHVRGFRSVIALPWRQQRAILGKALRSPHAVWDRFRSAWRRSGRLDGSGTREAHRGNRSRRELPAATGPLSNLTMLGETDLVSVVLIFLDGERFLAEAIDSIIGQTYSRWELILVDDGSAPAATSIARRYAEFDSARIRYLEHPGHANRGMSASRNLGILHSRGEFVAMMDADDVWLPHKLERQVAILHQHPEAGMVYGATKYWYSWTGDPADLERDYTPDPGVPPNRAFPPGTLTPNLYPFGVGTTPFQCDTIFRRDALWRSGGFEEEFPGIFEDCVFYHKVFLDETVFVSGECWGLYRIHAASCSAAERNEETMDGAELRFLLWVSGLLERGGLTGSDLSAGLEEAFARCRKRIALGPWFLRLAGGGAGRLVVSADLSSIRIEIDEVGSGPSHDVQVSVRKPGLRAGRRYQVGFEARADRARTMSIGVARFGDRAWVQRESWDGVGCYQAVDLSTSWGTFDFTFDATIDAEVSRVHFDLGLEPTSVDVRAVQLVEVRDDTGDSVKDCSRTVESKA